MRIMDGELFNGDTSGRSATIEKRTDGADRMTTIHNATLGAGAVFSLLPTVASAAVPFFSQGIFLAGGMDLRLTLAAVAVSEDSRLGITARIDGGIPSVTLTSPTDATETVNEDKVV